MNINTLDLIDFKKVDALLEGFNKATGFVTAILDLDGNVLSKSGWRQICTEFHRINPETSKKCTTSDTILAGKMEAGERYHFYKCLNGLIDVAVPIVINGEHIANLFSGQFFFEEPDRNFFIKQAKEFGFNEGNYLEALEKVPVVSKEKVLDAMDFLLNMTQLISEMTFQKLEQIELNNTIIKSEEKFKTVFESANVGKSITLLTGEIYVNQTFCDMLGYPREELQNKKWQDLTPEDEISYVQNKLEPLLKGEKDSARFEKRYICKNGTHIWADVSVSLHRNLRGEPLHFITTIIEITERKQAEEALRESQEQFRIAQNMSPDGFTILRPVRDAQERVVDFTWVYENAAVARLNGTDPEAVVGKHLLEMFPGHRETPLLRAYQQVAESGESCIFEVDYSGESMLNPTSFRIVVVSMGGDIAILAQDITERKQAEEKQAQAYELLTNLARLVPGVIYQYRLYPDGRSAFPYSSPGMFSIYEVTPEQVREDATSVFGRLHPDDADRVSKLIFESARSLEEFYCEFRVILPVQGLRWLWSQAHPERTEDGGTIWHGIISDITERMKINEKVQRSEQRFSIAFHSSPAGMTITRISDGKFVDANDSFCSMFEFSKEEVIGHTSTDLNMWTADERKKMIEEQIKSGGLNNFELTARAKSGRGVNILFSSKPMELSGELHLITTMIDITERKRVETALKESEEKFKHVFETANVGKSITLPTGELFVNQAFADMLGYSREELSKITWQELTPLDEIVSIQEIVDSLLKGEQDSARFTKRYIHKKGSFVWVDISVAIRRDADNKPLYFITTIVDITEHKRAEFKLSESEERLRLATEQANVAVWEYDFNINSMARSENHDKLYGLEWQTKWDLNTFQNATHPYDREYSNQIIQNSVAPNGPDNYHFDFRVVFPDKSIRWLHVNGRVIERNESGQGIKVRGTLIDVTEQKQSVETLRQSEEKFSVMFRKAPFSAALSSISDFKLTEVNEQFEKLWGYSDAEAIGKTSDELGLYPDIIERARLSAIFREKGFIHNVETKMRTKTGELKDVLINSDIVKVGKEQFVLSTVQNITERKRLENERQKFFLLAESSSEFIGMCDLEMNPIYVNPAGQCLVGLPDMAAACQVKVQDYFFPEDQRFIAEEFFPRVLREGHGDVEIRLRHFLTGEPIWMYYYLFRVHDARGALIGWATVSRDITERKRLIEALEQLNDELEQKVLMRTAQLEASNKELEAFSYSVSHDLRAPLRHINGFVNLLNNQFREDLPDKANHYLNVISDSAKQMGILIDDLLQFSKISRQELRRETMDMNAVVQEVLEMLKPDTENRKIFWTVAEFPLVIGDYSLLKQVWMNLLENAVKYSKYNDETEIEIGFTQEPDHWVFFVRDNGVGFDMQFAQKLFGVFQRLHSPAQFEGTGIGLANVQRIIHKHGGRVWASAQTDKGATFNFTLPMDIH